ncbi:TMEM198/TM7SF3 family protein [Lachnospiraceae bacterium KGMB03038]|nr:TMEM198/TM7SF3 family protein [Lachnospiraceae bacterium KGMB03038]
MEQVLSSGSNVVTNASGNARQIAEQIGGQPSLEALIAMTVVGLLICFFGLKLVKIQVALVGLCIGALIGVAVSRAMDISGITFAIIVFACAALLAALSFFLYRFGVFCLVFCIAVGIGIQFIDLRETLQLIIVLAAALVISVVAVIFVEPMVIICTAISGGITAGTSIGTAAGFESAWIGYAIGGVLLAAGMAVQFMLHSRKVGKKEKIYSEQVKEKDSVESEVEKARMILDDSEEE